MTGTSELKHGDLRRLFDIIEEGHRDDSGEALPWSVMDGLHSLVPVDVAVAFLETNLHSHDTVFAQYIEGGVRGYEGASAVAEDERVFWETFWTSWCSLPQRTGDLTSILTDEEHRFCPSDAGQMFTDYLRPGGVEHCMVVSLPTKQSHMRRLLFQRGPGHPFSERDRQALALLRPHLFEIFLAAERRRNGVPSLTPREWEVLSLAATGLTNSQIAHRLVLSTGTVRKHVEHILERLQVHTRGEAAAVALPQAPHQRHRGAARVGA